VPCGVIEFSGIKIKGYSKAVDDACA